jgi:hypothetical protein
MTTSSPLIVVENFYQDPDQVRKHALSADYYDPDGYGYRSASDGWIQNNLYHPFDGWLASVRKHRYLTNENLGKLSEILNTSIDRQHWFDGSFWNGSFQVKTNSSRMAIHSHGMSNPYNACWPGGWTGIVFLHPRPLENTGVSVWQHKTHSLEDPSWFLDRDLTNWDKIDEAENVYNRLVIMPADAFHTGTCGWGQSPMDARLIQTFFFQSTDAYLPENEAEAFYQALNIELEAHYKHHRVVYHKGQFTQL